MAPCFSVPGAGGTWQAAGGRLYVPKVPGEDGEPASQTPREREATGLGGEHLQCVCLQAGGTQPQLPLRPSPALASAPAPPPQARARRTPPPSAARGARPASASPRCSLSRQKVSSGKELGAATARGGGGRGWSRSRDRAWEQRRCGRSRCSRAREPPSVPLPEAEGGGDSGGQPGLRGQSREGGHAGGLAPGAAGQRPGPGAQRRRFMQPGRLGSSGGGGGGGG